MTVLADTCSIANYVTHTTVKTRFTFPRKEVLSHIQAKLYDEEETMSRPVTW